MRPTEKHKLDLKEIREQMKDFFTRGERAEIYHGTTNSTRAQKFERGKVIDISRLSRIIEVNAAEQYVLVEPNVPMDELVEETLRYRLVPPVVMEFPGITVGGGTVITASPTHNRDLFYGTACSYGSLGIITLIKLRLVHAKDFVHLTYRAVRGFTEAITLMEKEVGETADFVDGILFAKNRGVIMTGSFSDKKNLPVSTFSKRADEWFYLHADTLSKRHERYEELIPLKDYLFRYDKGGFWAGRHAFVFFKIPFTRLTRYMFNSVFQTRILYRFLHATNISQQYFVQDLSLPKENVLRFLRFIDDTLQIYPLWLCPLRPGRKDKLSPNCIETSLVMNVGVWDEFRHGYSQFVQANRDVEKKVAELRGRKVLYAHAYYPRDEFWEIYDRAWYSALRDKYSANSVFPDIYEKTKVGEKYKPAILIDIWKALCSSKLPIS